MKTNAKLIGNLVHRVSVRLPYKSGRKIEVVEQDPIVQQSVTAIVELSKYTLSIVSSNLGYVLENISKAHQIADKNVSVDVMQSKLFVLRLISACMQHHWEFCRDLEKEKNKDMLTKDSDVVVPPLDGPLVTYMLSLMNRYIDQYYLTEGSMKLEQHSNSISIADFLECENESGYTYEQIRLMVDIYRAASKVVYYISNSNWDACYTKIKNAVISLDSINGYSEKVSPDIRMLESCCLTTDRLAIVFSELGPYFLHMKNEKKLLFSKMIRKSIWKWIEEYPSQFAEVCASDARLLAGSEVFFDICSTVSDNTTKKATLWPLQVILLVLSPESLKQAFRDTPPMHNRRADFLNVLRKALQSTQNVDIAALCFIDLCKAATYVPPDNESVMRSIAAEIELELRDKVWDTKKLTISESNLDTLDHTLNEQSLVTDFLLSYLRLHPGKTLKELIPTCIEENVPIVYKIAVVKACLSILEDEKKLPWCPPISTMYNRLCSPLRELFLQTIRSDLNKHSSLKKKEAQNISNNRVELLLDMLRLFRIDTKLAILGDDLNRIDQNSAFMVGLMTLFQHPVQRIRQDALELLVDMHRVNNILEWGPADSALHNFWKISSPVVLNLSQKLLDNKSNEDSLKYLLQLLKKILKLRNVFLKTKQISITAEYSNMHERLQASVALEIALLFSLCSPNKEICDEAYQCVGILCKEARIVDIEESREINTFTIACNLKIYEELSFVDSGLIGRKAQQKRIRKYLRMISCYTPGIMTAWEESWKRWKQLTVLITRLSEDNNEEALIDSVNGYTSTVSNYGSNNTISNSNGSGNIKTHLTWSNDKIRSGNNSTLMSIPKIHQTSESFEELAAEWQNITGFLAALGGCCLVDIESCPDIEEITNQFRVLSNSEEPFDMVDRFISDMTVMLVSDNVYISEGMKEMLGNELSPALYVLLFQHLEKQIDACFDSNGDAVRSPQNKMFVEQSILVLKLILDRLVNPGDCLLNIDFSILIHRFADYLNRLPNTQSVLRIKMKMCYLIEAVMQKREQVVIRDEVRLRNRLLEISVDWIDDLVLRKNIENAQKNEKVQKDLDLACLKAIVSLLQKLPLQPSEAIRPVDISQMKSKMFLKYFGFFRKLLDKFKPINRDGTKSLTNGPMVSRDISSRSLASGYTASSDNFADMNQMKELIIMAMSHLLSSNVDAGLKFALSMSYDEDLETRKAFMQILTNILDQGAEFETLAETIMTDRYEKLIDMIVDVDMEIVMSLCEVCPSQHIMGVAEILLICFESREKVMSLLKAVVEKEISLTDQEASLFRGTTIATRILSIFAKQSCLDYVRITLQPAILEINTLPDEQLAWEMDPQKVGSMEEVIRNRQNVIRTTEILLNAICSSIPNVPRVFREELSLIGKAVAEKFPDAKFTAIGGFVFLRLFGPAILTPENAGFSKQALPKNSNVRKILLQATRVIQNLSNNILFGSKEKHMVILNDFLTSNIFKVANFLRAISTLPPMNPDEQFSGIRMDQTGYVKLHKYLSDNLERMTRNLTSRRVTRGSYAETQSIIGRKKYLDRLSNLLAQIGKPSDIPNSELTYARNYTISSSNHYYSDFMRRNAHRDLSAISSRNVFYLGGVSKGGRPVFYYISYVMPSDETDSELLVYYMLRVMEPYLNNPFELLFDTTEFSAARSLPIHWMTQFFQLVFNEMNDYLVSLHLYNPNTYLQRYIRKLPRAIVNKLVKRSHFSTSVSELSEHIAPSMIKLPKETLDLEKESTVTISPVVRITNFRSSIPVIVKIGPEHMQVITTKKQEILYNINSVLRDIYHISNIEDMVALPSTDPENGGEISIKYDKGKSTMVLSTDKRDILLTSFRNNKHRYDATKPTSINERAVRPNDVPGRLLNMALLNIGSEDPKLRLSAYNLLYSLSLSFQFNVGNQLMNAKDICIPSNSSDFVVSISQSLANSEIHLTLEFLNEALAGFAKSSDTIKQLCLDYMAPWLKNLAIVTRGTSDDHRKNISKTKDIIRSFIDMTVRRSELYKHIQAKIWKTIAEVDDIVNLVIECFVQYSVENGVGSVQAELITDTLVTMSSVSIRGKVISRMRRVIESTSVQPCRNLTDHQSWAEIAILLRFILMLSFNNTDPVMPYIPEIFHIVSILVVTGPTFIRSSVHELVVNTIHTLCTMGIPLMDENIKKLHFVLNDLCDSKNRVSFGLTKQHANAFTITKETTSDFVDSIDLISLQNIIGILLDALNFGAPTLDIANMWRARWMGLVTSTAFYFNPAVQSRSFVTLGCLAKDEVDDNLVYQILVALKGALAIFNEADSSLIVSIVMCLSNIIDHLPSDSKYLRQLFWLAISLVQIGHPIIFQTAVQFLESVLHALDSKKFFSHHSIEEVLLKSYEEFMSLGIDLDSVCEINFKQHFSFSIAVILHKGLQQCDNKDIVFKCLCTFLEIDCKQSVSQGLIEAKSLGYFGALLPYTIKKNTMRTIIRLSGLSDIELNGAIIAPSNGGIFSLLDISDNETGLLLVSFLVNLLNASDNHAEKLYLYTILVDAAKLLPESLALVYNALVPKMNVLLVNSQNNDAVEIAKKLLMTTHSEPGYNFTGQPLSTKRDAKKLDLSNLPLLSLSEPTFTSIKTNIPLNVKPVNKLLSYIVEQR